MCAKWRCFSFTETRTNLVRITLVLQLNTRTTTTTTTTLLLLPLGAQSFHAGTHQTAPGQWTQHSQMPLVRPTARQPRELSNTRGWSPCSVLGMGPRAFTRMTQPRAGRRFRRQPPPYKSPLPRGGASTRGEMSARWMGCDFASETKP